MGRSNSETISYLYEVLLMEVRKTALESILSKLNNDKNSNMASMNSTQKEVFSEPLPESATGSIKGAAIFGSLYIGFIIFFLLCTFVSAWKYGDGSLIGTVLGGGIIGAIFVALMIAFPIRGLLVGGILLYGYSGIFRESYASVLIVLLIISSILTVIYAINASRWGEEKKQSDMSDYSKRQNDFEKNKKAKVEALQQQLKILNRKIAMVNGEYLHVNELLAKYYGLGILAPRILQCKS